MNKELNKLLREQKQCMKRHIDRYTDFIMNKERKKYKNDSEYFKELWENINNVELIDEYFKELVNCDGIWIWNQHPMEPNRVDNIDEYYEDNSSYLQWWLSWTPENMSGKEEEPWEEA